MAPRFGEATQKFLIGKSWEGREDAYDVSRQSEFFDYLSYLIIDFQELPIEIYPRKPLGFQQKLAHLSSSGLVNKQPHSPNTWPKCKYPYL